MSLLKATLNKYLIVNKVSQIHDLAIKVLSELQENFPFNLFQMKNINKFYCFSIINFIIFIIIELTWGARMFKKKKLLSIRTKKEKLKIKKEIHVDQAGTLESLE